MGLLMADIDRLGSLLPLTVAIKMQVRKERKLGRILK